MHSSLRKYKGNKDFYNEVFTLALPIVFQQLITTTLSLIDNIMVGSLGEAAIAGVAICNRYYFLFLAPIFGSSGAAGALIAQYYGAKKFEKLKQVFVSLNIIAIFSAILFTLAGLFFPKEIVGLFVIEASTISAGSAYLKIFSLMLVPHAMSLALMYSMRSVRETKLPMYISSTSIVTNTMLNYLLINGNYGFPALGVEGAALATVVSRLIEFALYLLVYFKKDLKFNVKLSLAHTFEYKTLLQVITKAFPLAVNEILWSSVQSFKFMFYGKYGSEVLSALSISNNIVMMAFIVNTGIFNATHVIIGNRLGENRLEDAKTTGYYLLGLGVVIIIIMSVIMAIVASYFVSLFNVEYELRNLAQTIIYIDALMLWCMPIIGLTFAMLVAGGDTKSTMLMDSGFEWAIIIPALFILINFLKVSFLTVYFAIYGIQLMKAIYANYLLEKGKWIKNLTTEVT